MRNRSGSAVVTRVEKDALSALSHTVSFDARLPHKPNHLITLTLERVLRLKISALENTDYNHRVISDYDNDSIEINGAHNPEAYSTEYRISTKLMR